MKFSRIDLADCTTPEQLIAEINKLHAGLFEIPIPIREWALQLDIVAIKSLETEGFEGGLVMFPDRSSGTILVHDASNDRRKRFTIGHELGHFLLPWHTPRNGQGFLCSAKDMAIFRAQPGGDRYIEMEAQANRFAAGILMPPVPFRAHLRAYRNFEIFHIVELATKFNVSKEACARRCADLHDDQIAVIFSRSGIIARTYLGKDFPRLNVVNGEALPAASVAKSARLQLGQTSVWDEAPADRWLQSAKGTVSEQSIGQANDFRMTLLVFEPESTEPEEDEEVQRAWSPPSFGRRR